MALLQCPLATALGVTGGPSRHFSLHWDPLRAEVWGQPAIPSLKASCFCGQLPWDEKPSLFTDFQRASSPPQLSAVVLYGNFQSLFLGNLLP